MHVKEALVPEGGDQAAAKGGCKGLGYLVAAWAQQLLSPLLRTTWVDGIAPWGIRLCTRKQKEPLRVLVMQHNWRSHTLRRWTDTSSASSDPHLLSTTPWLISRGVVAVSDGWPCTSSLISPVTHHWPGSTFLSMQVATHFIMLCHYNKAQTTDRWPVCAHVLCVCVYTGQHWCWSCYWCSFRLVHNWWMNRPFLY